MKRTEARSRVPHATLAPPQRRGVGSMLPLPMAFFLPNLGTTELMVVAFVSLLIFGNRLPSVMRSLGKSVTEFKKGVAGLEEDIDKAVTADSDKDDKKPSPPPAG